jgi:hypothetical protein
MPRSHHATAPRVRFGTWSRAHFERVLEEDGRLNGLTNALINELPEQFGQTELEEAILALPDHMAYRPDIHRVLQVVRDVATAAYQAEFSPATPLSSRTLMPVTLDERNGIEDARFVRFTDADGTTDYRATYTAYDGHRIASRLLVWRIPIAMAVAIVLAVCWADKSVIGGRATSLCSDWKHRAIGPTLATRGSAC